MIEGYLIYALIGIVIGLIAYTIYLHQKINKLLRGESENLEESVHTVIKELNDVQKFREELEPYLSTVEKRLRRSLQGLHTLRFDPFKGDGSGGKQSFASAFLSEDGDGVIISSLHSRDRMSVYSKPISKFSSPFDLTEEEAVALREAKKSATL